MQLLYGILLAALQIKQRLLQRPMVNTLRRNNSEGFESPEIRINYFVDYRSPLLDAAEAENISPVCTCKRTWLKMYSLREECL